MFLVVLTFTLLKSQNSQYLDTVKLAMDLSSSIYFGAEDDFSYLDGRGGTPLINGVEEFGIPKFSLWKGPDDVLWLIVRGSIDIDDWISDFEFVEIENETLGAHFHSGYFFSAEGVWNKVAQEVKQQNLSSFIITGHSRGASVAEILHVIGRRDLRNAGLPDNIQTLAFAPMPSMSAEGDVLDCQKNITIFVHNRDIVPLLFFKPIAEIAYVACEVFDRKEDTEICKVIENKNIDDFINQYVHIDTVIGHQVFWLKYNCDFFGFNCKVKTDLKDAVSSVKELMAFDPNRLSLNENGTAFQDHGGLHYLKYITQLTQFTITTTSTPTEEPAELVAFDKKKAK